MTSQIRVRLKKFEKSERERKRVTLIAITYQTKLQRILEKHVKTNFLQLKYTEKYQNFNKPNNLYIAFTYMLKKD